MNAKTLYDMFSASFEAVGVIDTKTYVEEANKMHRDIPEVIYPTMVVLGLAYPKRFMKHTKTHLYPIFLYLWQ